MDMNPQRVRTAEFKTIKKGLDPDEVQAFLTAVADELERAQNQSTAMEARARAAVARLQELSEGAALQSQATDVEDTADSTTSVTASVDQAETISRTLLLAQRTADTTIAEAQAEADALRSHAEGEAARTLDSTREMAATLVDEARAEAHKVGEEERLVLDAEVNSLLARRDFLESDVDHMEQFLIAQRARIRDAAADLVEITERVPSGLGEARRPLLSAVNQDSADTAGVEVESDAAVDASADADVSFDDTGEFDAIHDAGGDEADEDADDERDDAEVAEDDAIVGELWNLDDDSADTSASSNVSDDDVETDGDIRFSFGGDNG